MINFESKFGEIAIAAKPNKLKIKQKKGINNYKKLKNYRLSFRF